MASRIEGSVTTAKMKNPANRLDVGLVYRREVIGRRSDMRGAEAPGTCFRGQTGGLYLMGWPVGDTLELSVYDKVLSR